MDPKKIDIQELKKTYKITESLQKLDDDLIGLQSVKKRITEITAILFMDKIRQDFGLSKYYPGLHMSFTGSPGTGKSTVLKAVIRLAKALWHVVVKSCTNSRNGTGYWSRDIILAASGARRIHSSTGFTNGEIAKFRKATRRTKKCVALVVVEDISTQVSSHLGLLSLACLRVTGHNNEDFGGIPTILCGDFGQVLDQVERGPCSGFVDS